MAAPAVDPDLATRVLTARIDSAPCVVDRQAGAAVRLAEIGVELKALISLRGLG